MTISWADEGPITITHIVIYDSATPEGGWPDEEDDE